MSLENRPDKDPRVDRTILHVDMDAYFAAVEQMDNPDLKNRPVVVGGQARRGVVAAASYEARAFGIYSAMPMAEALRRNPDIVVVPPRHTRYTEISRRIFRIFERFTPLVEGLSLDEAFLDVSACGALFGDGPAIAGRIKALIRAETGLTASAGVAANKFLAKIASDLEKPDGLVVVPHNAAAFIAPLPITKMWGVGPNTDQRLQTYGYHTIGDLAAASPGPLTAILGRWAESVINLSRGHDDRPVVPERDAKSISAEETWEDDITTTKALDKQLLKLAAKVADRLSEEGLAASVVRVKIKYADFKVASRQTRLHEPAFDTDTLFRTARDLSRQFPRRGKGVRLAGVAAAELTSGPLQQSLFPDSEMETRRELQRLTQKVGRKFGPKTLTRARLLE